MSKIKFLFLLLAALFLTIGENSYAQEQEREIYQIKIYHLENEDQEKQVETFLEGAYLPALQREGIVNVGVFKPVKEDSTYGKRIYVLIPFPSIEKVVELPASLARDNTFMEQGRSYHNASHDDPPYQRIETILMQAFAGMPRIHSSTVGNEPDAIYELRSYEAATEKLFRNKVQMFNQGEIDIFTRLGFNPVFFGEVIAGSKMPNLMYITSFRNMKARDAHWDTFGKDAAWGEMSVMQIYQNNVSHIDAMLLNPTSYSTL